VADVTYTADDGVLQTWVLTRRSQVPLLGHCALRRQTGVSDLSKVTAQQQLHMAAGFELTTVES